MSDTSVLSHEYKTASELSRDINEALITIKKSRLTIPGAEISQEQVEASGLKLAGILDAFVALLEPAKTITPANGISIQVPGVLVSRLRRDRKGNLTYYLEDLERVAAQLRKDPSKVTNKDLALLDQLAAVADAEASNVFRRLMRTYWEQHIVESLNEP